MSLLITLALLYIAPSFVIASPVALIPNVLTRGDCLPYSHSCMQCVSMGCHYHGHSGFPTGCLEPSFESSLSACAGGECCEADHSQEKCGLSNRGPTHDGIFFGDYTAEAQQVQGSLFVGGNVDLRNVDIGKWGRGEGFNDILEIGVADLMVVGSCSWDCGEHYGPLFYGATPPVEKSVSREMPASLLSGLKDKMKEEEDAWKTFSQSWGQKESTGYLVEALDGVTEVNVFTGQSASPEVFVISCAELSSRMVAFDGLSHNPSFVLVNVLGQCPTSLTHGFSVKASGALYNGQQANMDPSAIHATSSKVMWNFRDTQSLDINDVAWEGTILAPLANIKSTGGILFGQVIGNSWSGNAEISHRPFKGCTDLDPCGHMGQVGAICPAFAVPDTCINPRQAVPDGECCPRWLCDENCDNVPCAILDCAQGWTIKVLSMAGTDDNPCCDVMTCELLEDYTPPEIVGCPTEDSFTAVANPDSNALEISWPEITATDNQVVASLTSSRASGSKFDVGSHEVVVTAADAAGNEATCTFTVTITLEPDTSPPVIENIPQDVTFECVGGDQTVTVVEPEGGDSNNNANDVTIEWSIVDVPSGVCDSNYKKIIQWTATDLAGNVAVAVQTTTHQDTTPPSFTSMPVDMTIEEGQAFPEANAMEAVDACSADVVTQTITDEEGGVNIWRAVDACGNVASVTQRITMVSSVETTSDEPLSVQATERLRTSIAPPEDLVSECGIVFAMGLVDARVRMKCFRDTENACETRDICKYLPVDNSEYTVDELVDIVFVQTITVKDTQPPYFTNAPVDIRGVYKLPAVAEVTAYDMCSTPTVQFTESSEATTTVRVWTAVDECGHVAYHKQTIVLETGFCVEDGGTIHQNYARWKPSVCTFAQCDHGEIMLMSMSCPLITCPNNAEPYNDVTDTVNCCTLKCPEVPPTCNVELCPVLVCGPDYVLTQRQDEEDVVSIGGRRLMSNSGDEARSDWCCPQWFCAPPVCTQEVKMCPDGVTVVRRTGHSCGWEECPEISCSEEVQTCAGGHFVRRVAPTCDFEACPNPCKNVNCGVNGKCNQGKCDCKNGFSGTLCQNAPEAKKYEFLLHQQTFVAPRNTGPAFKCEKGKCRSSASLGIVWQDLGSDVYAVLAVSSNGGTVYAVSKDGYIIRSSNSGLTWEEGIAVQDKYIQDIQYSELYNHAMFENFRSGPTETDEGQFLPTAFDFELDNGEAWYVTNTGVFGYTAATFSVDADSQEYGKRAYMYFTSWFSDTAVKSVVFCYPRCKNQDCGDYGRCLRHSGVCQCYEGWRGDFCKTPPSSGTVTIGGR